MGEALEDFGSKGAHGGPCALQCVVLGVQNARQFAKPIAHLQRPLSDALSLVGPSMYHTARAHILLHWPALLREEGQAP